MWMTPAMQRHSALSSYLKELGLVYGEGRLTQIPERLRFHSLTLQLDPWERDILQRSVCNEDPAAPPWAPLLAEGIAFQVKCLERFAREPEPGRHASETFTVSVSPDAPEGGMVTAPEPVADPHVSEESAQALVREIEDELEQLVNDAAVGLALMQEAQRAIDRLVIAGEIATAKKLTAFRHRLGQGVGRLKDRIGAEAYERAENKSEGMVAPTPAAQIHSGSTGDVPAGAVDPNSPAARKQGRPGEITYRTESEPVNRAKPLGILFVALTVIWMIFFLPRLFKPQAHVLQRAEFGGIPAITRVEARPPSVFVTVDSVDFGRLTAEERLEALQQIGDVAHKAGYVGADVRDQDGQVVGRWFVQKGAELLLKPAE